MRDAVTLPAFHPPVTDLAAASDGRLWIRREEVDTTSVRWDVVDTETRLVAFDVPWVVKMEVVGPGG